MEAALVIAGLVLLSRQGSSANTPAAPVVAPDTDAEKAARKVNDAVAEAARLAESVRKLYESFTK